MLRLISRIDVRNGYHIKTICCEGVQKICSVEESIEHYSTAENESDEIILIDTVASLYGSDNWLLRQTDLEHFYCQIPISIGGGIRNVADAENTLARGADKLVINTAAIENPNLIEELSNRFGQQAIILQLDVREINGEYICFTTGGREPSSRKLSEWLSLSQKLGVGEFHITSIATEGTASKFPDQLAEQCVSIATIPLIVSGGIQDAQHMMHLWTSYGLDSFSFSSLTNRHGYLVSEIRNDLLKLGGRVRCPLI